MARARLSGKVGAALDPCAALQVPFELADGEEREIVFRLGVGRNAADAGDLVQRFRGPTAAARRARRGAGALEAHARRRAGGNAGRRRSTCWPTAGCCTRRWPAACGRAAATTNPAAPSASATSCRTSMALVHAEPALLREHLLRCAGRQFVEGDVQHWWHPPSGRGVRTRCSDDYLWLPLATARYVKATGDTGVLDESIPFLEGRPVEPGRRFLLRPARAGPRNRPASTSTACAPSSTACNSARTACR